MSKITTIIVVALLLIILLMGAYSLSLKKHIDNLNVRIAELESKYNESKNEINSNADRISYYVDIIQRLDADYTFRKELFLSPLTLKALRPTK